ncbi:hypothetical protein NDU88_007098 [Pleurodeles waltl]|uniref:Uncharacterized protein n=1 Tax=Pleurodeles waltl TaxID=8319 RepID=A0AAV7RS03_PLEWA|nr:hypothetical protein NDU88_007098 [Pleurodeles waltl]
MSTGASDGGVDGRVTRSSATRAQKQQSGRLGPLQWGGLERRRPRAVPAGRTGHPVRPGASPQTGPVWAAAAVEEPPAAAASNRAGPLALRKVRGRTAGPGPTAVAVATTDCHPEGGGEVRT